MDDVSKIGQGDDVYNKRERFVLLCGKEKVLIASCREHHQPWPLKNDHTFYSKQDEHTGPRALVASLDLVRIPGGTKKLNFIVSFPNRFVENKDCCVFELSALCLLFYIVKGFM